MGKSEKKIRTSKRNFIIAVILVLLTNISMGVTLMSMSKKSVREQMEQRMLDVANVAAYQLDGDDMKTMSSKDKGTEKYEKALKILRSFEDTIQLDYIYGVRDEGDNVFTFTIDPDVEDPGEFGEQIETTDALRNAAAGIPSVDQKPHTDEWGTFYSAYSPIFDSNGNVAGIVGVDFAASWYDNNLSSKRAVTIIITMVSTIIAIILSFIIMSQNRKSFTIMLNNISDLVEQTKKLDDIIIKSSIKKLDFLPKSQNQVLKTLAAGENEYTHTDDEYEEINSSIEIAQLKLEKYLKYISSEVYIDDMTGTRNKAAYKKKIVDVDEKIKEGEFVFSIAFFDINELKKIYVKYGFEAGEELMYDCAQILKDIFSKNNVYHITGDEFIVIADNKSHLDMKEYFDKFDEKIKESNENKDTNHKLSVSKGICVYNPEKHSSYRDVFSEAKEKCDIDKAMYYKTKEINI